MSTINAYINFKGQCREAMNFYKDAFGGDLELFEVAGSPMEPYHNGPKDQLYHSSLVSGDMVLMGTDMTGPKGYTKGTNVQIAIACSSKDDAHNFFAKLSAGGTVTMELGKTFWAELFGEVNDKYGITWMINYDKPAE